MAAKSHEELLSLLGGITASGFAEAYNDDQTTWLAQLLDEAPAKYVALHNSWVEDGVTKGQIAQLDKHVRKYLRERKAAFKKQNASGPRVLKDGEFEYDEFGKLTKCAHNIRLTLQQLDTDVRHNEFNDLLYVNGKPIDDKILDDLWVALDDTYRFQPTKDHFGTVLGQMGRLNRFHPVRDWLNTLKWDGVPRLKTWITKYLGAEDTELNSEFGRLWLKGGVARIFNPGVKFDVMLLLQGEQGLSKSLAFATLVPDPLWFTDSLPLGAKEQVVIEATRGKWIVEISDLKGNTRAEVDDVKAQLSQQWDRARMAYARLPIDVPRQFIHGGTTNSEKPMSDLTGNRRYWVVQCFPVLPDGLIDIPGLAEVKDQLWAEAMVEYWLDPNITLDPKYYDDARELQASFTKENPYENRLGYMLGELEGVIPTEVLWEALGLVSNVNERKRGASEFGAAMKALGWTRNPKRVPGKGKQSCYHKGNDTHWIGLVASESGRATLGYVVYKDGEPLQEDRGWDDTPTT